MDVRIKRSESNCSGARSRSNVRCRISIGSCRSLTAPMQSRWLCATVSSKQGRKGAAMTECPQCGTMNEDDIKNCRACRINMYWAFQHYEELTALREASKLAPRPETASFLIETSKRIDEGPTVGWLRNTIKKFGFKGAGKKVSTIAE